MNKQNDSRDIESDLKGLEKIFRACFERNENPIPAYKGPDHRPLSDRYPSMKDRFKPGSEGYEYMEERGYDLVNALLTCAWQLGFDLCYLTKYEEARETIKVLTRVTAVNKSKQEADDRMLSTLEDTMRLIKEIHEDNAVGLIDAMSTIARVLAPGLPKTQKVQDALTDLKENTKIKDLLA